MMVWVNIWGDESLLNRYNEKFAKVEEFVRNTKFTGWRTHFDTVICFTESKSFAFDCTTSQFYKLLKILEENKIPRI